MGKLIFVLGGTRSGKSRYALRLAKSNRKVAFIGTCVPRDREMKERVKNHRDERPRHWKTFEEPLRLSILIQRIGGRFEVIIIDCLTLFLSNLMAEGFKEDEIKKKTQELLNVLKGTAGKFILISNEVGLGIVPRNRLARKFRDTAGKVNQWAAEKADRVVFMVAGLPLTVKGDRRG